MVISDDHVHAPRLGVGNGLVGSDAGIAGQDEINPLRDEPFQHREIDAVALLAAMRDVIANGRLWRRTLPGCQLPQRGNQNRR